MRSPFEERWRRRFEEYGRDFDDDAGIAGWSEIGLGARLRHFQRAWQPDATGGRWLDAGCGAGTYSRHLAGAGMEVLGLDYSFPTIVRARDRGGAIMWAVADVTRLPSSNGAFDGALCFGVLQALSDPEAAIRELVRCLRPGGELWVDALNAGCGPTVVRRWLSRIRGQRLRLRYDFPAALTASLRAAGLESVRVHWVPILPGRMGRYQWLFETGRARQVFRLVPWLASVVSHAFVVSGCLPDEARKR